MKTNGKTIVISGPSGAGKNTLIHHLIDENNNLVHCISTTTRDPRKGERDGDDYHFIKKQEFQNSVDNDEFLEWAIVHEHYYGTSHKEINRIHDLGKDAILDIDIQGALQIQNKASQAILIFIEPPSMEILEERLRKRGTEAEEKIQKRMREADEEMKHKGKYHHIVINDTIDNACKKLNDIILTNV